ncbi:unnamed protein product [Protopolystoma xenopodis]|uniref:Uncharacterized protein n=1 Tax=Protopolystoma xenopodis TaxID=117903 RepID=A0A3S5BEZ9_9PLAT|nr:unnamed protein product [Protopolystoma xenopodis]
MNSSTRHHFREEVMRISASEQTFLGQIVYLLDASDPRLADPPSCVATAAVSYSPVASFGVVIATDRMSSPSNGPVGRKTAGRSANLASLVDSVWPLARLSGPLETREVCWPADAGPSDGVGWARLEQTSRTDSSSSSTFELASWSASSDQAE